MSIELRISAKGVVESVYIDASAIMNSVKMFYVLISLV